MKLDQGRCGCGVIVQRASMRQGYVECESCAQRRRELVVAKAGQRQTGVDSWNPSAPLRTSYWGVLVDATPAFFGVDRSAKAFRFSDECEAPDYEDDEL